jgi:tetratricopeptide (TPR) repeat protein
VKALTYKALVLMARGDWGDAEAPLKRALAIDPTYGPLLDGAAKLLSHAAGVRAAKAARLRETTTWQDSMYYYWRRPTQAELDQADALDRQAQALWALARTSLESAARLHAGKPLGLYYAGIIASQENRAADAQAAFEECVRLDPTFQSAWDELAVIYAARGMGREAAEAKSRSVNLVHTTAGHMLRYAWGNIPKTKYKTARQALESAIAYDPADPRACAYLGVIAAADEQPDAALGWFRAAAALDEARSVLSGTSLRSTAPTKVPAQAAGFTLALNNRLGALAVSLNRPDVAAEAYRRNIALERRVPRGEWFAPLAVSMLPDADPGALGSAPEADAVVSLVMESHTGLGESLVKQGRRDEALKEFRTSLAMPDLRHPTQEPIYRVGEPALRAKIGILKMMMADKQWVTAEKELQSGSGWQGHPTKATTDEYYKIGQEIQRQAQNARQSESDAEAAEYRRRYTPPQPPPRRRPTR